MWKSDFRMGGHAEIWFLFSSAMTISQIFWCMEICQWPSLILTHTGIEFAFPSPRLFPEVPEKQLFWHFFPFFLLRVIVINQKITVAVEEQMLTKKTSTETFLTNFMMAKTKLHSWKDENQKLWLQWSGSYLILLYWVEICMADLWWLAIHLTTHQEQVLGGPCIQRWSPYASIS